MYGRAPKLSTLTKPKFLGLIFCLFLLVVFRATPRFRRLQTQPRGPTTFEQHAIQNHSDHRVELVVASLKAENTAWFGEYLPHWHRSIYVVDDRDAVLKIPENKGREAMVYLTYIIDHYNDLPEYILFLHAGRWQWHNDDPDYDGYAVLQKLRLDHVSQSGYVSLRCVWVLGCPVEIQPLDIDANSGENRITAAAYKKAFQSFFPGKDVPAMVGVTCCAQFAATQETIRRRTRQDYIGYRDWLLATDLEDSVSGRIFEYSWHIIFGKEAVHCPLAKDCYCRLFGLCDLECYEGECKDRYTLPKYATLPKGWPLVGWEGEKRAFAGPL